MSWSASQYTKFEDERTRPVRDLIAAIPDTDARKVADLGCGPGNSTELLAARFAGAHVLGIDSSENMIDAARKRLPAISFEVADIAAWPDAGPFDALLANASLQWVADHARLFPALAGKLAPGGSLAVQMPDNVTEPSHVLMHEVAASGPWRDRLATATRDTLGSPAWHYALLRPLSSRVDVWRTTYHHTLPGGIDGIIEWFKGSALGPYLKPLDKDEQTEFLQVYREKLGTAYALLPDGSVLLPFPRLFFVATK